MSEFTEKNRWIDIYQFTVQIIENGGSRELFDSYKDKLKSVLPMDVVMAFHQVVKDGYSMDVVKSAVSKVLNVLYEPLISYDKPNYTKNSLLYYLEKDNLLLKEKLTKLKSVVKEFLKNKDLTLISILENELQMIYNFEKHYVVKENVLFPVIEHEINEHGCLQIMWSIHDDVRGYFKNLRELFNNQRFDFNKFNKIIGKMYFDMNNLVFRENAILFPVVSMYINNELFSTLMSDVAEIGLPYVNIKIQNNDFSDKNFVRDEYVDLGTGKLSVEQVMLIFNSLPVDITFVDENDTVRFFSTPKDRIFVRTKAVIGRKVQNCHPHDSIEVVNKIIDAFKKGKRNKADFWINLNGKLVLIQYFAVRDTKGNYKGLIEVTQDVTNIKKLEGEKRLLDWE